MKKTFVRVLVPIFLVILGHPSSSTATLIIYLNEDTYTTNPLSSDAISNQQYLINLRQSKSSVLSLDSSTGDNNVIAAGSLLKTSYKNYSGINPRVILGTNTNLSIIIADLFPAQHLDDVYIVSELTALRNYLTGDGTVYFLTDYNKSVFTHTNPNMNIRQELNNQHQTAVQTERMHRRPPDDHTAARNHIQTLEAPLNVGPVTAQEPETILAKMEPLKKFSKPEGKLLLAPTIKREQTAPGPDTLAPKITAKEKSAKLREPVVIFRTQADFAAVEPFVESWAEAWEQKNVEIYLSHYSSDFITPGGISRTTWERQRHQRLGKPQFIKIKIRDIQKQKVINSRIRVTFIQDYQSDTYSDQGIKTLDLIWENGAWRIVEEMSRVLEKR